MGWQFRRSKKFGPFKLTASKSGLSFSSGSKTSRLTKRADGRWQQTVRLPGIGLYKTQILGNNSASARSQKEAFWLGILYFVFLIFKLFFVIIFGIIKLPFLMVWFALTTDNFAPKRRRRRF